MVLHRQMHFAMVNSSWIVGFQTHFQSTIVLTPISSFHGVIDFRSFYMVMFAVQILFISMFFGSVKNDEKGMSTVFFFRAVPRHAETRRSRYCIVLQNAVCAAQLIEIAKSSSFFTELGTNRLYNTIFKVLKIFFQEVLPRLLS